MLCLRRSLLSSAALSLLCTVFLSGQTPAPPAPSGTPASSAPAGTADPFAAESFVLQRQDTVFSFNADGTGYREATLAVTVQSEAALRNFSVVAIPFASNSEKVELHYVRVRRRDGTVVETPLTQAIEQTEEVTREAPFYSDLKQEQIPVRSLGVGDTLEWQARVVRTHAEAPGEFWGQESFVEPGDAVVREASVELRMPKAKAVTVWTNPRFLATLAPAASAQPTDTTAGDQRIVRWEFSSLRPTVGKAADAAKEARKKRRLTPDEELDNEQGKLPTLAWTTFPSWAAVGAWYRGLQGDRTAPDAEIKARVAELTAGKATDEDKVRALYAFTSSQIRYIGVAFGVGRYQPHRAEDVLSNGYGDCKDKETLLASMLAVLGIHADAVLIGSGIRFNPAVPSPGAFNHLITRVDLAGQPIWLDPTAEVAPFRVLFAPLRDRQALVIPAADPAILERTPPQLPFAADEEWSATGTLDNTGTSESHIVLTLRGDTELIIRTVVRQVPPASYNELAQKFVQGFGYVGTPSHAEFSRPEDTNEPLRFAFDYHREKNGDWDNHRILPQLAPLFLPTVDEKEPPVASLDLQTPRTEHSIAQLKLPEGWSAELPEAVHQKTPWATYDLTYRLDHGTLTTERTVKVLQQKVPASDWQAYKKWQDATGLGMENYVQLTRTQAPSSPATRKSAPKSPTADAPAKPQPAPGSAPNSKDPVASTDAKEARDPADAANQLHALYSEMQAAYDRHDANALEALVQSMRAIDPKARRLNAWAGSLAALRGNQQEALADNRKELELYPDELDRYAAIVFYQGRLRDKQGAAATLQEWARADPDNPQPWLDMAHLSLADKQFPQAVEQAQHAVENAPAGSTSAEPARLLLGQAQLQAGKAEDARTTLVALLNATSNPGMQNDAAYELTNAGMELPLAEQAERASLSSLTEETAAWTGDESPAILRQKTALLIASWDTMGWILFKQGKLKEAQAYIAASWINGQHAVVRDHLVTVQTALGPGFAKTPEAVDLRRDGQAVRTVPLGKAAGRSGVAEYRLLLAHGRVERAEPTDSKTLPGGADLLQSAHLPQLFPPGSDAHLVRTAMLNCHGDICELVFAPL